MIFDELGLPKEMGASDLQDSARLAGIISTFNYRHDALPLEKYIYGYGERRKYVRHPSEIRYDFSRDQAICLFAGYYFNFQSDLVDLKLVDGKDIWSPAARGHVRRCKKQKANWFQDAWFWFDIWRAAHFQKLKEPNQLMCMLRVAGEKHVSYWVNTNKQWRQAILNYWCEGAGAWRGERDLAMHMIKDFERYEKKT